MIDMHEFTLYEPVLIMLPKAPVDRVYLLMRSLANINSLIVCLRFIEESYPPSTSCHSLNSPMANFDSRFISFEH